MCECGLPVVSKTTGSFFFEIPSKISTLASKSEFKKILKAKQNNLVYRLWLWLLLYEHWMVASGTGLSFVLARVL